MHICFYLIYRSVKSSLQSRYRFVPCPARFTFILIIYAWDYPPYLYLFFSPENHHLFSNSIEFCLFVSWQLEESGHHHPDLNYPLPPQLHLVTHNSISPAMDSSQHSYTFPSLNLEWQLPSVLPQALFLAGSHKTLSLNFPSPWPYKRPHILYRSICSGL